MQMEQSQKMAMVLEDSLETIQGNQPFFYSGKEGTGSVLEQELRGIDIGLQLAKEMGYRHITIASDSSLVVNIIEGSKAEPWYLRNITKSIRIQCNSFTWWKVKNCFRETN